MAAYWTGFAGGALFALPLGFLVAVVVGTVIQRRKRRQHRVRAVSAEQFARELDEWVKELDEESAEKTQQAPDSES